MITRSIVGLTFIITAGCQATAGASAEVKSAGRTDESRLTGPTSTLSNDDQDGDSAPAPAAMLGARAGLRLNTIGEATCQCLGVVVGNPTDARFTWEGPSPKTDPETQLVVGLSSEGLTCPSAAPDSLGASYHGYEVIGADVIIQVETARLGRPIAQGAVVPKPTGGGGILMRAIDAKSPYGRSPDGKSPSCAVWPAP